MAAGASLSPPVARTLGSTLERQRLEHRQVRTERVLEALRGRATFRGDRTGTMPRPLAHAIESFTRELSDIRRRLDLLPH